MLHKRELTKMLMYSALLIVLPDIEFSDHTDCRAPLYGQLHFYVAGRLLQNG